MSSISKQHSSQLIKEALTEIALSGQSLHEKLSEISKLGPDEVSSLIREHFNSPIIDLASCKIHQVALSLIPENVARHYAVLPIELSGNSLKVAMNDPTDFALIRELRFISRKVIEPLLSSRTVIQKMIDTAYGKRSSNPAASTTKTTAHSLHGHGKSPVVKLVNELIVSAIRKNASDIHFEPSEADLKVRFRIDGVLQEISSIPNVKKAEVLSRIKIMASLDIAEKRRPQDGKIRVDNDGHGIDIRVSTLPTTFGEKIVLRILDKSNVALNLTSLGMDQSKLKAFEDVIVRPYGMVLVTGPTGSGKTTTLYAALNRLKSSAVNISTVEDPIEYHLDGINQTHVKPEIGSIVFSSLTDAFKARPQHHHGRRNPRPRDG